MIGLSKRDILACFGQPAQRVPSGQATEIWTYTGGQMRGYGPQWAIGLNTNLIPFTPGGSCDVVLVMTNASRRRERAQVSDDHFDRKQHQRGDPKRLSDHEPDRPPADGKQRLE
jgi:hypothetical protein